MTALGHKSYLEDAMERVTASAEREHALAAALKAVSVDGDGECWCSEYCYQMPPGDRTPICVANKKLLKEHRE